jgi:hypothetical protein
MFHQDAHGLIKSAILGPRLVKLAILIWLISLLVMPTELSTYLFT